MATYLLEGAGTAGLPRRPLAVSLSIEGNPGGARLVARLESTGAEAPGVRRHSAGLLIIPRVEEPIVVAAVPDGGRERFDATTTLHVSIGIDSGPDPESDVAQLAPREVSGLTSIELVTLAPSATDQILVTTRLIQTDVPLPELAARARVACRGVLGVDQLPVGRQRALGCVVDVSTSMAPVAADGSLSAAAEIVAGIAAVVGGQAPIRTVLADDARSMVLIGVAAELPARIRAGIEARGYGLSPDLQAAVTELGSDIGLVVLITDSPGPPVIGPAGVAVTRLVLSESSVATGYPGFRGAVCPRPPAGQGAVAHLTGNPQIIDRVVAGLVAPLTGSAI